MRARSPHSHSAVCCIRTSATTPSSLVKRSPLTPVVPRAARTNISWPQDPCATSRTKNLRMPYALILRKSKALAPALMHSSNCLSSAKNASSLPMTQHQQRTLLPKRSSTPLRERYQKPASPTLRSALRTLLPVSSCATLSDCGTDFQRIHPNSARLRRHWSACARSMKLINSPHDGRSAVVKRLMSPAPLR